MEFANTVFSFYLFTYPRVGVVVGGVRSEAISKKHVNLPADIAGAGGPAHKSSGLTMTSFSKCVTDTHNTHVSFILKKSGPHQSLKFLEGSFM